MSATSSSFDLSGRVAVVTGGNRGIGRAIALGMARAGAAVAVLSRNEEKNHAVRAEIEALGRAPSPAGSMWRSGRASHRR